MIRVIDHTYCKHFDTNCSFRVALHIMGFRSSCYFMIFDCRSLGSVDRLNTLLSLAKSQPVPTDPYRYFTDRRIVANGFAIQEYKGKPQV